MARLDEACIEGRFSFLVVVAYESLFNVENRRKVFRVPHNFYHLLFDVHRRYSYPVRHSLPNFIIRVQIPNRNRSVSARGDGGLGRLGDLPFFAVRLLLYVDFAGTFWISIRESNFLDLPLLVIHSDFFPRPSWVGVDISFAVRFGGRGGNSSSLVLSVRYDSFSP